MELNSLAVRAESCTVKASVAQWYKAPCLGTIGQCSIPASEPLVFFVIHVYPTEMT